MRAMLSFDRINRINRIALLCNMECGGLPPLLTAGASPCAVNGFVLSGNGGKPPFEKRRQAAALHIAKQESRKR